MKHVQSHPDFNRQSSGNKYAYLLLYKPGSELSSCAVRNLTEASGEGHEGEVFAADVNTVRDIHPQYGIDTVPALLVFEDGTYRNTVKGCHDSRFYKSLLDHTAMQVTANTAEGKPAKRVTVYSTPTCSWCNTLKSWLKKEGISFSDIDVSKDQKAAEEMVRKSGQQGVPQTDVNGRVVIGFNQPMLKELLEIR